MFALSVTTSNSNVTVLSCDNTGEMLRKALGKPVGAGAQMLTKKSEKVKHVSLLANDGSRWMVRLVGQQILNSSVAKGAFFQLLLLGKALQAIPSKCTFANSPSRM